MYLFVLDEFGDDLTRTAQQLGLSFSKKPPVLVSSWCNNFAKHHLGLLIQHHPIMIVADSYGDKWAEFKKVLPNSDVVDACGNQRPGGDARTNCHVLPVTIEHPQGEPFGPLIASPSAPLIYVGN
jgi:hypothetical protein